MLNSLPEVYFQVVPNITIMITTAAARADD